MPQKYKTPSKKKRKKRGRPKVYGPVLWVRLPKHLQKKLEEAAKEKRMTVSEYVRVVIALRLIVDHPELREEMEKEFLKVWKTMPLDDYFISSAAKNFLIDIKPEILKQFGKEYERFVGSFALDVSALDIGKFKKKKKKK